MIRQTQFFVNDEGGGVGGASDPGDTVEDPVTVTDSEPISRESDPISYPTEPEPTDPGPTSYPAGGGSTGGGPDLSDPDWGNQPGAAGGASDQPTAAGYSLDIMPTGLFLLGGGLLLIIYLFKAKKI